MRLNMKTKVGWLLVAALLLAAGSAQSAKDAKNDTAKFAGKWTIEELTYDGNDHSKLKINIVFKGDEGIIEGDARVKNEYARIKFKLDPTTTPKIMEIKIAGGSQTDATMEAIYELKGDELRICARVFGKGRPTKFESPEGESIALVVLKR